MDAGFFDFCLIVLIRYSNLWICRFNRA